MIDIVVNLYARNFIKISRVKIIRLGLVNCRFRKNKAGQNYVVYVIIKLFEII